MIKNFFLATLRHILRHRGFAFINLLGLTIALSVAALIILYIVHEKGYDRFHELSDRIFRIAIRGEINGQNLDVAVSSAPFGPALTRDYPEVVQYTRMDLNRSSSLITIGNSSYYEEDLLYADSAFFSMFSVPLLQGDLATVLDQPGSVVLTRSLAGKYFPEGDAMGKVIQFNKQLDLTVTGICEDYPDQSHFRFNMVFSFATLAETRGQAWMDEWGALSIYTYILLDNPASINSLEQKLPTFLESYFAEELRESNVSFEAYLQALPDIHLQSDLMAEMGDNSDISYIYILMAITVFILVLASINFMNLSTAKSANRSREVGIRKVAGSSKKLLVLQFLGESVLISLMALGFAFILIELLLPLFNQISGKNLDMNYLMDWQLTLGFLLLTILVGLLAGSYPAFYLSSFHPLRVLTGKLKASSSNKALRNILVLVQFAVSIALIIATMIIYLQLSFVGNKNLGFEKEHVVVIPLRNPDTRTKAALLKNEMLTQPDILAVSLSNGYPGGTQEGTGYFPEGYGETDPWLIYGFDADADFIEGTMKMKVLEGRNFMKDMATDSTAVIINEVLLRDLNWEDPIGKIIEADQQDGTQYTIIGVLKDFHNQSLHQQINPMMIKYLRTDPRYLLVKLLADDIDGALKSLNESWSRINPEFPFDYHFLDERIDEYYEYESRIGKIFIYFALFALFIAALGLFGLASFISEQRTKEIGIRKAMGSSVTMISILLSKDFARPVLLANLLAWPVAWLVMKKWLQNFQYQTSIPIWIFILAAICTLLLAMITINMQIIRAASANPVKSLRYE